MKASREKLWELLIGKDMNGRDFVRIANVSTSTLTKLSKDESANAEMLIRLDIVHTNQAKSAVQGQ